MIGSANIGRRSVPLEIGSDRLSLVQPDFLCVRDLTQFDHSNHPWKEDGLVD